MVKAPQRFEIFWINLEPTVGSEIKKTRPCVVISPNDINNHLRTVIIAPLTTSSRPYPSRIPVTVNSKSGEIVLDQLRTIDKSRLQKKVMQLDVHTAKKVSQVLVEMFSY